MEAATHTARATPIGLTMVGDMGDYVSCCKKHFKLSSVYHNAKLLLKNPAHDDMEIY